MEAEQPLDSEPQLFCIRVKADGTQEQIWGTPPPPDFHVPAAVTLTIEEARSESERDSDGWQP